MVGLLGSVDNVGAGPLKIPVREVGRDAGTILHVDGVTLACQLGYGEGGKPNPVLLPVDFFGNSDDHGSRLRNGQVALALAFLNDGDSGARMRGGIGSLQ